MRVEQTRTSPSNSSEASATPSAKKSGRAALIEEGKKSANEKTAGSAARAGDVNSDISPRAKEFARAKEVASAAPDVRETKIAEIKKRIADGKYQVDARELADRMVDEHMNASLD